MASQPPPGKLRVDGDGVRMLEPPGARGVLRLLALAAGLIAVTVVAVILTIRMAPRRLPEESPRAELGPVVATATPAPPLRPAPPPSAAPSPPRVLPVPVAAPPPPPAAARAADPAPPPEDDTPEKEAPMFGFAPPGEEATTGIAVFPPRGTKPIKRGIVVPEDFELPPGYVRHYQATDDGQRVPAILMFSPDFQSVTVDGKQVPIPEDRIVPPELAPPGLPIEMLRVPEKPGASDPRP